MPAAVKEEEREESKLDPLEVAILLLGASSAAIEEEEEEESELADLPCFDKGLGAFFFFFSFLSKLASPLVCWVSTLRRYLVLLGVLLVN